MVDRITPGTPIPRDAAFWNRLIEIAGRRDPQISSFSRSPADTSDVVMFCKSGGANFDRFDVVKIETIFTPPDPADDEAYKARKPVPSIYAMTQDWIDAVGTWGVTLDPIRGDEDHVGECGRVLLLGTTQVLVDIRDTTHEWARPKHGVAYLESCDYGPARLIHRPDETGSHWSMILLNHQAPDVVLFQAPEGGIGARSGIDISFEQCEVMAINGTDELVLTTDTIEVYNWLSQDVCTNGDRLGIAAKRGSRWFVIADDCQDESSTTF